ncbi:conserved protein of unknown function [Petrocella atlantisensis]|uniref:Uncharacterized protein n=1 Tax=Petrocella atlantisensis TaxID=2173034 RepID=A0A3P7NYM2_9FIRM|nr:MAG: hypothetical protein CVV00_05780 [Firmicutes bacterium HGW-Firmicutes-5]VDN48334.1 conserved protein of unknown function [Petrocella atlantisensis]
MISQGQTLLAFNNENPQKKAPRDFTKKNRNVKDKSNIYLIEKMWMLDDLLDTAVEEYRTYKRNSQKNDVSYDGISQIYRSLYIDIIKREYS